MPRVKRTNSKSREHGGMFSLSMQPLWCRSFAQPLCRAEVRRTGDPYVQLLPQINKAISALLVAGKFASGLDQGIGLTTQTGLLALLYKDIVRVVLVADQFFRNDMWGV